MDSDGASTGASDDAGDGDGDGDGDEPLGPCEALIAHYLDCGLIDAEDVAPLVAECEADLAAATPEACAAALVDLIECQTALSCAGLVGYYPCALQVEALDDACPSRTDDGGTSAETGG